MKTNKIKSQTIGHKVKWKWMGRMVTGTVLKSYEKPIQKNIRGFTFRRNGSPDTPAYLVKSEAGSEVLKSHSELKWIK